MVRTLMTVDEDLLLTLPCLDSIVFSCWRESLKELSKALKLANVDVAIIDGSLTLSERRIVLKNFERQGGISVLLMTLGTGAVGYESSLLLPCVS